MTRRMDYIGVRFSDIWRIFQIVGVRSSLFLGLVTAVVVFLLAILQVASRHALKDYADDQLGRIPWDISVYQSAETGFGHTGTVAANLRGLPQVASTENLFFLRAAVPTIRPYVDDQPLLTPWVSVLMATDDALLPPELRPEKGRAVVALVGKNRLLATHFCSSKVSSDSTSRQLVAATK